MHDDTENTSRGETIKYNENKYVIDAFVCVFLPYASYKCGCTGAFATKK